jgi:dihydroflavonol-4-reductase
MKIAITGANGHVGVNLCDSLLNAGHQVNAFCHENDYGLKNLKVNIIRGDIQDRKSLMDLVSNVEIVFHLAARISIKGDREGILRKINVEGTRNILEASKAAGVKRFIHFSSIHAFQHGPVTQLIDEEGPLVNSTAFAYDRSKADGERLVKEAANNGMDALILSPTAIIGPMDFEPSLSGKALIQLYRRQIPSLVPGGYNWVDVRDIVHAAINSIDKGRPGEKYLLSGTWYSLPQLSALIRQATGVKTIRRVVPFWMAHLGLPFIAAYSMISGSEPLYTGESLEIIRKGSKNISNAKARKELDFHPRELNETIADTFQWFKMNGYIH